MILLLRVDHRLLHGQVAFAWTNTISADCILIANDQVVHDDVRKTTMKLAKPAGTKLVIKNIADSIQAIQEGKTDKYKLLIVVESVEDAYKLATACQISSINLGGTTVREGTRNISKVVNLTQQEEDLLEKLQQNHVEIEIRQVPNDKKILYKRER